MSQFNSLSENFRKSLESLGDELVAKKIEQSKKEASRNESILRIGRAFVEGPVMAWYTGLDDESKNEVDRVLGEVDQLKPEEILEIMKIDGNVTPMGFLDRLFAVADQKEIQSK